MAIVLSIIQSIMMAFLASGATAGLIWFVSRKKEQSERQVYPAYWGLPLAIGFGFLVGYSQVIDAVYPEFPPTDSTQWTYYLVFPVLVLALLQALNKWPLKTGFLLKLALLESYFYLLLKPLIGDGEYGWGLPKGMLIVSGLALIGTLLWFGLSDLSNRLGKVQMGPLLSGAWLIAIGSSSAFFMLGHSASLNQLATILAASASVLFFVSLKYPGLDFSRGLTAVILPLYLGLNLSAHFFSELSAWAILVPFSLLLLYLSLLSPLSSLSKFKKWVAFMVLIAAFNGGLLAAHSFTQPTAEADPYDDYYSRLPPKRPWKLKSQI